MTIIMAIVALVGTYVTPLLATVFGGGGVAALIAGIFAPSKTWKWIMVGVGIAVLVIAAAAFMHHYDVISVKADKYDKLSASNHSLEVQYGCPQRQASEQDLAACFPARERDAAAEHLRLMSDLQETAKKAIDAKAAEAKTKGDLLDQAYDEISALKEDPPPPDPIVRALRAVR